MEIVMEYYPQVLSIVTQIAAVIVAITSFVKALKSEKRLMLKVADNEINVASKLQELDQKVAVTRAGIVQGFKDAVITKDIKVSVNNQVQKILDEKLDHIVSVVKKNEERRTQLTYWMTKIIQNTAAYNKLTTEEKSELDEIMALIAEDEKIVDTIV